MNSLLCSLASSKVLLLADENFAVMIRPSRETKGVGDDSYLMALDTLSRNSVVSSVFPTEDTVLRYVLPVEELPASLREEGETYPVEVTQVESEVLVQLAADWVL
jgi:hypothetical protein